MSKVRINSTFLSGILLCIAICGCCLSRTNPSYDINLQHVYEVNKNVSSFSEEEDFSSPEAAYVAVNRVMAKGELSNWRYISIKALSNKLPPLDAKRQEVSSEEADVRLNAQILEVHIFKDCHAVVIAKLPYETRPPRFEQRSFELENGKWLNAGGHRIYDNLDSARICADSWSKFYVKPVRTVISNPDSYIRPFVHFLKEYSKNPKEFVLDALAKYKITIIGEIHHRPRYWAFNSLLVTDPIFAKNVGTIYLELPSNNQKLVDQFLVSKECDTKLIIDMLRDNLWMGWPDQAMLDFFVTLWMVNQDLAPELKLRIILVDMERPWKEINTKKDWQKYNADRDRLMADNIIRNIHQHPDEKRNALFIVGVGHAGLNLKYFEGSPVQTAGWHLRQNFGGNNVYAIFQHQCRMANSGEVDGRLVYGLFDTAFSMVKNKFIAFPLDIGPFGNETFDVFSDKPPMSSVYKDGFNAYLYLGPLETEYFSPLIAGFYTDEFVKELDRRYSMMFKRSWANRYQQDKMDAESFINWMSGIGSSWGKPRKWRKNLGPINAWKFGNNQDEIIQDEKNKYAFDHPEIIRKVADDFFEQIRTANYDYFLDPNNVDSHNKFIIPEYTTLRDYPGWVKWICRTFRVNPIKSVELGRVFKSKVASVWGGKPGIPAISYKLILKDGSVLEGVLPFAYNVKQQCWKAELGVDWHLQPDKR